VLSAVSLSYRFEREPAYRARLASRAWGPAPAAGAQVLADVTIPREELTRGAVLGVVSAPVDGDGILRRVPLMFSVYGHAVPGFALALIHAGAPPPHSVLEGDVLRVAGRAWPVNASGELLLRYPRGLDRLRTIPFYQAALAASGVAGLEPLAAALKGRIVIVGSSSIALGDFVETPLGRVSGVKAQALITQLLLDGHVFRARSWGWQCVLAVLALGLAFAAGHPRLLRNTWLSWGVAPLLMLLIGLLGALLVARGQAVGLLFAFTAGLVAHAAGVAYRQMQLYRGNQQLALEKRSALEADRLKSRFLSHITHELRTPLTAIMGFNNINWHGDDLGREQRMANSEIVDRNCQHMLSLVNNLLDQAKLEAGQLTIQRHPDKPHAVIRDAVATVAPLVMGKPVKIRTDEIDVPEALDIDAFRVRQILLNLLSNAIKFTETGEVAVVSTWQDGQLTMSVIDTGPGMPPDVLNRLFSAFTQADAGVAARHGGTGLGLTISRNLARLMGGDIVVRSTVGQGTVFTVTLDAPRSAATGVRAATAPASGHALSGVALLAEDRPDVRALFTRQLEQLGLTVLQADDGKKAIEMALAQRPDVVLMDMEMPLVAGAEATRTLRMCGFRACYEL
jgi:signal transduction histidine kinase